MRLPPLPTYQEVSIRQFSRYLSRQLCARSLAVMADGAVSASPLVIACFLDHASVHEVLDPVARRLTGGSLVNLTTTTPNQARQLAAWADRHAVRYLDGGIMAVPDMIGRPGPAPPYNGPGGGVDA